MKKIKEILIKNKIYILIIGLIIIFIVGLILFISNKKNYQVYLDLYLPNDSSGYIVYSKNNKNEVNLYQNSYLNIEYTFNDNKKRNIEYIVSNNDIIKIKENKLYAKNIGETTIYIQTKDKIKSNKIDIKVVNDNE